MAPKKPSKTTTSSSLPAPSIQAKTKTRSHSHHVQVILKSLNPKRLHLEPLVPLKDSSVGLGPAFSDVAPSELADFYPSGESPLPFNSEFPLISKKGKKVKPSFSVRNWPTYHSSWSSWVNRLSKDEKISSQWKKQGIYDLIQISKSSITFDPNLLFPALFFWSSTTNSLHLKCGMMSPTLRDICYITGLKPHGDDVSATLFVEQFLFPTKTTGSKKFISSHLPFIKHCKRTGPVQEEEHIAFLICWLSGHLLCVPSGQVTKDFVQLAVSLAKNGDLALAPLVLAHLYRGLHDLLSSKFARFQGSFLLFQMWLKVYFPNRTAPLIVPSGKSLLYHSLATADPSPFSFAENFEYFYNQCETGNDSFFDPFTAIGRMPSWLVPSPGVSTKKHSEDWKNIWASFLLARDLHYSTAQPTLKNSFCGVEFYNPAQLARQMGFTQMIPLPPYKSYNRFFDQRVRLTDAEQFAAIDQAYAAERAAFDFKGHTSKPLSTNEFDVWWSAYISSTRTKNHKAVCDSILASFKPLSPDEEEEIPEESEEEEGGEKTTALASKTEGVAESGDVSIESLSSGDDDEEMEEVEEETPEEEGDVLYKAKGKSKTSQVSQCD